MAQYDGPTTCDGPGDFQHHAYGCDNGVPKFRVASWQNSDGSTTVVPANLRAPNASPGTIEGTVIIQPGSQGPNTLWVFHLDQGGYVDFGAEAKPLVVYNSDGTVKSAGFNPGTGKWIGLDGATGVNPDNAKLLPQAVADVQAAASRLSGLF